MSNTKKCNTCARYSPLLKLAGKQGTTPQKRGHCLAASVFASNKPGGPVYPPGAKIEELEYGRSKPVIVLGDAVMADCANYKEKAND